MEEGHGGAKLVASWRWEAEREEPGQDTAPKDPPPSSRPHIPRLPPAPKSPLSYELISGSVHQ